ncbi:hypothetical protein LTR66_006724 [Elasticomyces elasticus]|nr:hypothetical protein LTR66_006724 [Elasticomyces elasticus]
MEQPVFQPRKLRVVCVGAGQTRQFSIPPSSMLNLKGYSGLMIAHKYKYETPMTDYVDLTIYEKNHDVGGTWLENRYPGVACDVPAHIYTFSFAPNPNWSSFYAEGPEIWQYIKDTTIKYGLDEKVVFESKVVETVWDDEAGVWNIKIERKGEVINDQADVLINGAGILNKWRWPAIQGLDTFRGKLLHSAAWDSKLSWEGKRVAVIGNGSSAIQILPQMQKTASHITTYIRTATWISSNFAAEFARDGHNFKYSEEEKREFRENPAKLKALRKEIEHSFNMFFYALLNESPAQAAIYDIFKKSMTDRLKGDPELCAKLIPEWRVGCRRLTPGDGYLEALQEKNVSMQFNEIVEITPNGIRTQDGVEDFDIIVCATGFDVSFSPYWNLVGKNGSTLAKTWAHNPEAYFGICAPDTPNYFIFNGPNCPIGHGSLLAVMEWTAEYILRWVRKIATQSIKSATVSAKAVDDYNVYSQEFLKRTVWTSGCRSWYKNGKVDGKVTAMYAGSVLHYKEILEEFRTEDFEFEYRSKNRFAFMGNGMTVRETGKGLGGEDLGFYVKN